MNVHNETQTLLTKFEAEQLEQHRWYVHSWGPEWVEIFLICAFLLNPNCIHATFPVRDYYPNKIPLC